ncbi:MAG: hypothetical protein JXO48_11660 [Deltaproteobacteria bacterium]|nr:hypothetical protein [Deltaproteobacteria bacterium]
MKNISKGISIAAICIMVLLVAAGCTRYKQTVVPFQLPEASPNAIEAAGAVIASKVYNDTKAAEEAFGFDIIAAGVLPVQVAFDNKGTHSLEIIPQQTYLVDQDNNLWPILDAGIAYDRIAKKTEYGEVVSETAKPGLLGGAAGALIGAAIGIVTGENVAEAAGKGAAVGATAGVLMGGAKGVSEDETVQQKIGEDLKTRSLEKKDIPPHQIAHGFIFFPGEAAPKSPKELRLAIKETDSGVLHNVTINY